MEAHILHWDFSIRFVLAATAISLINDALLPPAVVIELMQENGPVEAATVLAYYLALASCWLFGRQSMDKLTMLALSILLLACVARELDLHKAMFGVSIVSAKFYADADAHQIAAALAILAPLLVSIAYLALRYGKRVISDARRRQPVAVTIVTILVSLPLAKVLDRSLSLLAERLAYIAPTALTALAQSLEEPLELMLPLLVCIALMQEQLGRHGSGAPA